MTDDTTPAQTLDCIGLLLPEPLFQTRESIDAIEVGEVLEVFADDPRQKKTSRASPSAPATKSWASTMKAVSCAS